MEAKRYSIPLSAFDYKVMTKNKMLVVMFGKYLETAKKKGDQRVLSLTLYEFEDLVGWVAGESKNAESMRISQELGAISVYLEGLLGQIKGAG